MPMFVTEFICVACGLHCYVKTASSISDRYQLSARVGFNIVWGVLYEHSEYNHSRLF